ncbi:MAG: AsmA family protein, partial [Comamonadaceae bacterium]
PDGDRPRLASLWRRELAIESVEVENAAFPRASVREFRGRLEKERAGGDLGSGWTLAPIPLERLRFRRVEWFDRRDIALSYDGDIAFDPHWRPREAELSRSEIEPPVRLRLRREGEEDRWRVDIDIAGGTWNGEAALDAKADGPLRLSARLAPRNVDVALLVAGFKRRSAVEGKLNGETSLDSEGATALDLVRRLHTRTRFDIHPATLKGFDLARAVQTAGTERAGSTPLDELSGTLDTQAGDDGVRLRYTGLKARSGVLTATGSATVFNRRLEGEASVDLIDDVLGVPFKLSGTLDKPELSMTRSAMAGAAIGTAVLPGVGTALGARLGERIGRLFDGPPDSGKATRRKAAPAVP